jgi:hypothetical protein
MSQDNAFSSDEQIILAHGGGGELTQQLLADRIFPRDVSA